MTHVTQVRQTEARHVACRVRDVVGLCELVIRCCECYLTFRVVPNADRKERPNQLPGTSVFEDSIASCLTTHNCTSTRSIGTRTGDRIVPEWINKCIIKIDIEHKLIDSLADERVKQVQPNGTMDDVEIVPCKRRKVDEDETCKPENGLVTSGIAQDEGENKEEKPKHIAGNFQMKSNVIERIRQMSKSYQKSIPPSKDGAEKENSSKNDKEELPNGDALAIGDRDKKQNDKNDKNEVKMPKSIEVAGDVSSTDDVMNKAERVDDVIVSSTGSSPARSPKPEDLAMLSTPPRLLKSVEKMLPKTSKALEQVTADLSDRFDQSLACGSPKHAQSCTTDTGDSEADRGETGSADAERRGNEAAVGGGAGTSVEMVVIDDADERDSEFESVNSVEEKERKGSSAETSFLSTEERPRLDFNSDELRTVLKQMIEEKFKVVESAYHSKDEEGELRRRVLRLEEENRNLQEYAGKLEKTVKLLLSNQQKNKSEKVCRAAQTDVIELPRPVIISKPSPLGVGIQAQRQLYPQGAIVGTTTETTSRLTSTLANMPGHSVSPSSLPQQVTFAQQQGQGSVQSVTVRPPPIQYQPQRAPPPQYVTQLRPQMRPQGLGVPPRGSIPIPNRPAPVTATVHPQTTPRLSQPNMVVSGSVVVSYRQPPNYPSPVQQPVYVSSGRQTGPVPMQQQAPSVQPTPMQAVANQTRTVVVARPPPQQVQRVPQEITILRQQQPQFQQQQSPVMVTRSPPVVRPPQMVGPPPLHQGHMTLVAGASPPVPRQPAPQEYRPNQPQLAPSVQGPPREAVAPEYQGSPPSYGSGSGPTQKEPPPRPTVSIAVVSNGIVLSWNMHSAPNTARVVRYQLYALQDVGPNGAPAQWKKIGVVNALPLPMACTLTQFMSGNKYHFAVRAMDEFGRSGPFSEPCTITLK